MAEEGGSSSRRNIISGSKARELHDRNKLVQEMATIHGEINEELRHFDRIQRDVAHRFEELRRATTITVDSKDTEEGLKDFFASNNMNGHPSWVGEVIVLGKTKGKRDKRVRKVTKIVEDYHGPRVKHLVRIVAADN